MDAAPPRDRALRRRDALAKLTTPGVDVWAASAGAGGSGAHLVPLSLAWVDERVVVAVHEGSRTARDLHAAGTARLGLGPTRDVVMLDVVLERAVPVSDPGAHELAERYAAQADWDPRDAGAGYLFLVLRPVRIQAWREANEIAGRTLMREGTWLA